ncbi:unnamed protein product [Chondrus crispus]|uniref:AAA+ ATPase domain-containing protein n=1 Tax=Chondrus crispus TaxID=2769 RepID=R7QBD9_CHOCR|nr:unnamed protein product [Chondrus crispus]CDF35379.1 unnamed protein product [Chondrus crispus]|eukprot:XP_005715198.1 unnamed protein product [Chondrus crispus]
MYTPTSLSRALSRSRIVKGAPPQNISSDGLACLSVGDMQRLKLHVLDILLLSFKQRTCLVVAWPLVTIPDNFIALDDASIASLGVTAMDPPRLAAYTSPKPKSAKRRTAKSRTRDESRASPRTPKSASQRVQNNHLSSPAERGHYQIRDSTHGNASLHPEGTQRDYPIEVQVLPRGETVVHATEVVASTDSDFLWSEETIAMVHSVLAGRFISPGMLIPISLLGNKIMLTIKSLRSSCSWRLSHEASQGTSGINFARYVSTTNIQILPSHETVVQKAPVASKLAVSIGGLGSQLRELSILAKAAFLEAAEEALDESKEEHADRLLTDKPRGILLYGPPGTGKTLLACAIGELCRAEVEILCGPDVLGNFSADAVKALEACFARARRKQPCVIVLDEIDAIAPKRDAAHVDNVQKKLTAALLTILDGYESALLRGLFVIGTTSRLDSIDAAVRRAGRFDREMEIPVPGFKERLEILEKLSAKAAKDNKLNVGREEMSMLARVCHGFVGADLSALWRESVTMAIRREPCGRVCYDDIFNALKLVKPSALREVAVEVPSTRWCDIGGKHHAKQRLKEAVEWPLTEKGAALFASLGVSPPSGILLFGPPGCSKTLLARAVASESGTNFISVKGAELLSKWVGESEKAVQAIFRRARQAAPCVIFFDEVDALAGSRSAAKGASAQARVVAQLLYEMDGVDTEVNDLSRRVVVIAATNRPDCLDEAFLRPGRMDVQIHVGLPDEEERLAILSVHTRDIPLAKDVDLEALAMDTLTAGFTGAEIGALVREAALAAMENDVENASIVSRHDFNRALERVRPRTPASVAQYFAKYVKQVERHKVL